MSGEPVFVWQGEGQYAARLAGDPQFLAERMRDAATRGETDAQLGLAHMLLEGHGTPRDPDAAFRWVQLAARSGRCDAINMLGRCHEIGWGTLRNARMAAHCYRVAAGMGHAWAQFNLAALMHHDEAVDGEPAEILALLGRAARGRNAKAMNMLGQACEEGWHGKRKPTAARRWYARAARGGCFRGCFNTARLHMEDGDISGAVDWLRRSIAAAPARFCTELGGYLAGHSDPRLREISAAARARAAAALIPPNTGIA